MTNLFLKGIIGLLPVMLIGLASAQPPAPPDTQGTAFYERRIRPLLAKRCYQCHSGQADKPQGGLRLDGRMGWLRGGDSGPAVVPGDPEKSLLIRAVRYRGPGVQMPPVGKLPEAEIAALIAWVRMGAPGPAVEAASGPTSALSAQTHWAFRPIHRPTLPKVKNAGWCRTPIDRFLLAKLEQNGLAPNPPADRRTLIRRVTYDLIGLPPTPEEVDAFLKDRSPHAYEKVVDRLLASPRYGERWGRHWLDVVHYGDTHGYDKDKRRDFAWPYRDYVIRAFNTDKPYARFIREQIAGDVLWPEDPEGIIATGFIAAGPWDLVGQVELAEGTVEKAKTRVLDRDDMVTNTISTFESVTVHCARCHNHKFDPIPQKDYYSLQAVFAGVERGDRQYFDRSVRERSVALAKRRKEILAQRAVLLQRAARVTSPPLARLDTELSGLKERLAGLPRPVGTAGSPSNGYHSGIADRPDTIKWVQVDLGWPVPIDTIRLIPARPTDFPDTPGFGFPIRYTVGLSNDPDFHATHILGHTSSADVPNPGDEPVEISARGIPARYVRVTALRLWKRTGDFVFALGEMQVESHGKNVALGATVTALDSIEAGRWSTKYLVDNYDSRNGLPDRSDPQVAARLQQRAALQAEIRSKEQARQALADALLDPTTRTGLKRTAAALAQVDAQIQAFPPAHLVYAVLPHTPRPINVLARGEVEQPREPVAPGALSCLPGLEATFRLADPADEGSRRAALANWIASPRNPLTWRSIVNRVWHYHFGRGLVDTPNDFGRHGSLPTHPELLDWLAATFLEPCANCPGANPYACGQSIKKLHRLIVLSAAYCQSSTDSPAGDRIDADNRLLWRQNRQRLDAEEVRDSVLAVSGTLDRRMGGPGVELFQYKDDFSPVYDYTAKGIADHSATWRRTVYCFTVRSVPNPFLECLDCADPNINTPVRNTTLTALQALALLNDPFMLRQAQYFASRLEGISRDPRRQIETAFALAFSRPPKQEERALLMDYAQKHGLANACRVLLNANEFMFVD